MSSAQLEPVWSRRDPHRHSEGPSSAMMFVCSARVKVRLAGVHVVSHGWPARVSAIHKVHGECVTHDHRVSAVDDHASCHGRCKSMPSKEGGVSLVWPGIDVIFHVVQEVDSAQERWLQSFVQPVVHRQIEIHSGIQAWPPSLVRAGSLVFSFVLQSCPILLQTGHSQTSGSHLYQGLHHKLTCSSTRHHIENSRPTAVGGSSRSADEYIVDASDRFVSSTSRRMSPVTVSSSNSLAAVFVLTFSLPMIATTAETCSILWVTSCGCSCFHRASRSSFSNAARRLVNVFGLGAELVPLHEADREVCSRPFPAPLALLLAWFSRCCMTTTPDDEAAHWKDTTRNSYSSNHILDTVKADVGRIKLLIPSHHRWIHEPLLYKQRIHQDQHLHLLHATSSHRHTFSHQMQNLPASCTRDGLHRDVVSQRFRGSSPWGHPTAHFQQHVFRIYGWFSAAHSTVFALVAMIFPRVQRCEMEVGTVSQSGFCPSVSVCQCPIHSLFSLFRARLFSS